MAEEQDGENTFSPTNSSKEHLNEPTLEKKKCEEWIMGTTMIIKN